MPVAVTCIPSRTIRGIAAKPSRVTGSLMKRLPPISPLRALASATMSSARSETICTCNWAPSGRISLIWWRTSRGSLPSRKRIVGLVVTPSIGR